MEELQQKVEEHLEQYNIMGTKRMDLVMFLYAIEHLSRVARVVRTGGNVLLVGVGGSGRQSCTRLAAFMSDYNVFQIEIAKGYGMVAFRDDVRKLLTNAGGKGEKSVTGGNACGCRLDSRRETSCRTPRIDFCAVRNPDYQV